MNLPVHLGMDSRVGDTGPVLCCHGGVKQYFFIHSFCRHSSPACFYSKQYTGTEKYILKRQSLPLMKLQYCKVRQYIQLSAVRKIHEVGEKEVMCSGRSLKSLLSCVLEGRIANCHSSFM